MGMLSRRDMGLSDDGIGGPVPQEDAPVVSEGNPTELDLLRSVVRKVFVDHEISRPVGTLLVDSPAYINTQVDITGAEWAAIIEACSTSDEPSPAVESPPYVERLASSPEGPITREGARRLVEWIDAAGRLHFEEQPNA